MLTLEAVVEYDYDREPWTLWKRAEDSLENWLRLSGEMTLEEVGTVLCRLARYSFRCEDEDIHTLSAAAIFTHLVNAEALILQGGLRLSDTATGVTVLPGCCCGLEHWRNWWDMTEPATWNTTRLWLGHDPHAYIERLPGDGTSLRVWADEQESAPHIDLSAETLPPLLHNVQRDLEGFLQRLAEWTAAVAPDHPEFTHTLPEAFDRNFHVRSL
jgi:hypothetical protein